MNGFKISTDKKLLDFDVIYNFISNSYWAKAIPVEVMQKAIKNSLCFGVFKQDNDGKTTEQVGFARVITDKATFAYLADVFILPAYQGLGLSKILVANIVAHPELQGLRRMMLATKDAHGLYQQYGFQPIDNPDLLMQIAKPDIYLTDKK
ncbi:MAG: GNAT family N-acetyltransferase [Gammaproteobacteria bacterium]|nr:GNAT family N-acetyltransferase [Gammaproteobacteria bacterium]